MKLALTCLLGFEQPRVLDGDHGLVGEGVDELDLAFGEWAHFDASNEDHPNSLACVNQRDRQHGANTGLDCNLPVLGVFICFGQDVCDLNRSPVDDGASCNAPTHKWYGELSDWAGRGNLPMVRDEPQ